MTDTIPHMRRIACTALIVTFLVGVAPAAEAKGYKTFRPEAGVTAKQVGPKKMRFVNTTTECVALTVTQRQGKGPYYLSATHRIEANTDVIESLWGRMRVTKIKVYGPGCY